MAKIRLKHRLERYEDFYNRAFTDVDVNDMLMEGAGESLESFKDKARGRTPNDFHDVMFNREKVKKKDSLGKEIWARFFRNENITKNKVGRLIVRKGHAFDFNKKTYKGGMFVPRDFLARRTNIISTGEKFEFKGKVYKKGMFTPRDTTGIKALHKDEREGLTLG